MSLLENYLHGLEEGKIWDKVKKVWRDHKGKILTGAALAAAGGYAAANPKQAKAAVGKAKDYGQQAKAKAKDYGQQAKAKATDYGQQAKTKVKGYTDSASTALKDFQAKRQSKKMQKNKAKFAAADKASTAAYDKMVNKKALKKTDAVTARRRSQEKAAISGTKKTKVSPTKGQTTTQKRRSQEKAAMAAKPGKRGLKHSLKQVQYAGQRKWNEYKRGKELSKKAAVAKKLKSNKAKFAAADKASVRSKDWRATR